MNVSTLVRKYKHSPVQARASLWYTICNILQKGISFVIVPIYVRILTTAEYGQYSVFQSWKDILIIFATLNLYCGVFTKGMVDYEENRDQYTASIQGLSTLITAGIFCIYLVAHQFWDRLLEMDNITVLLMFAYFIFYPAFSFWSVRQRVEYKYLKMVVVTIFSSVAIPIISIILLYTTDLREKAVIWGYLFVQCAVGAVFYVLHFVKGRKFYVKNYWEKALKFNMPLIPHYLSLIVLGQADRIMIKYLCGEDEVGIYTLAYQVSMVMNIVIAAVNNALVPWSYEKLKKRQYHQLKDISKKLCAGIALCVAGLILVAPEIISILGTEEYLQAIWIVPAVAVGSYFTFCYNLFSTVEFYYGATKFVMVASVIGAMLNVGLNAIFIPIFGYIAAGYTTMICYLTFMVMHYVFMRKVCVGEIGEDVVYDMPFIGVSSLALCVISAICMLLYNSGLIRWGLILVALLIVFIRRKKIIEALKLLK